ncbi:MAG: sulfatase family protein, partial [Nocardioidaceae bacterium]
FTDALSNYPLCCPARATLLTGQYAHNHGVRGNEWPYGGHRTFYDSGADKSTLPLWLQAAGYRTSFIGKYLNYYGSPSGDQYGGGQQYVPPGWDSWNGSLGQVFRYFCVRMNRNGNLTRFPGEYQTDLYTRLGRNVIGNMADGQEPFFLWVSHLAPHGGFTPGPDGPCTESEGFDPPPAPRHAGMFDGMPLPKSPARNEADMSDKNSFVRDREPRDLAATKVQHQARLESLQALDESVADTVQELRDQGVLDRTAIIFTSDNGWLLAEHRLSSKILPYEESLRVPLLVRGPGFPAGVTRGQPTGLVDITATAAELGGAVPTSVLDGVSLRDLAQDPSYLRNRVMPVEAGPPKELHGNEYIPEWLYRGVRSPRYSYVAWNAYGETEEEFYDLAADPYQLDSTHDVPSRELNALRLLNEQLEDCKGPSCVREFDPPGPAEPRLPAGDTTKPRISNLSAPQGWVRTARPTITYKASDPTDARSKLRHWCSQRALGCDGSGEVRLRLRGEGAHQWTIFVTDPAQNVASRTGRIGVDLERPRAGSTAERYAASRRSPTRWHVADSASGVVAVDVRLRTAGLTGSFSDWQRPGTLQNQTSPPRTVVARVGNGTTCWQIQAEDRVGRLSGWKAGLCRSRPADASDLAGGKRWRTVQQDGWYAGTAEVARRKGATLALDTAGRLATIRLVARTGTGQGRLRLTVGDGLLGRVDLSGYPRGLRAFRFDVPSSLSGTVRATVISDSRPTWVDSLGVVRRPPDWPAR